MYLNGLRTDAQSLGDRLGTRAFSNKCENLTLAHGQHSIVLNGSPDIPSQFFKHHRCDGGANIAFAGRYRADSVEQLGASDLITYPAAPASPKASITYSSSSYW